MTATTKTAMGFDRARLRAWSAALVLGLAASLPASRALGVYLTMDASKTDPNTVQLCVGLDSGGQKVAGTQNDMIWDASCSNLKPNSCAAVPDSKKPLHGNTPPTLQSTYRALVFALDNVDPIRDGKLYCCQFELTAPGDGCCAVRFDRLGASDPVGNALPLTGNPNSLCLATGLAPSGAAAAPPAAPPAPVAPVTAAPPPGTSGRVFWLVLVGVAVVLIVVLILRGRSS